MKIIPVFGLLCIAALLAAGAGCTGTSPQATTPAATPVPTSLPATTAAVAAAEPTATPYPGALALNFDAPFGTGGKNGTATAYKVLVLNEYSWTSPSFNSVHAQPLAGTGTDTQKGYNTEVPAAGNVFLFVYVRLADTGTASMIAPSPNQFIVHYAGRDYAYRSLEGNDVTIGSIRGTQYDYLIGKGGVAGYIQPGASNAADGFLIYEVPASIDLRHAWMVVTLDSGHSAAWALG
jgi:hypothetical protein